MEIRINAFQSKLILKRLVNSNRAIVLVATMSLFTTTGCHKDDDNNNTPTPTSSVNSVTSTNFQVVKLVSDTAGFGASRVDTNLSNAWGIAFSQTGNVWVASNHKGRAVILDQNGNQALNPLSIHKFAGAPTGIIENSTSSFIITSNGQPAKFIIAGEDGTISAWNTGDSTITVADRSSSDAVYKGLTIASDGGSNFLYVTNFKGGKIDVFDANFNYVTGKPFSDPTIPSGYAPFNIQNINGKLYVSYALHKGPDNEDDQSGFGNGFINIFNPNGTLIKRFATQGALNSPWGITMAPSGFGQLGNMILVGNFGDGRISAFDTTGTYKGQLQSDNTTIEINGLWDIKFVPSSITATNPNVLYFSGGPDEENHGLFGYITQK